MAPHTIAIRKNLNGIDPISPLPVRVNDFPKSKIPSPNSKTRRFLSGKSTNRKGVELEDLKNKYEETKVQMEVMKRQKTENNKRLLEMSGLVKSLQGIPVNYDKTIEGNNFVNVQRKIEAIMYEMDQAKKRYDELRDEKFFQNDTIKTQEHQIKEMEGQIALLNERLEKEEHEQKEEQSKAVEKQMANTEELEQQVMLQEMEIMNLMAEMDQLRQKKVRNGIGDQIKQQEASNAAKYAEIQKMEEQLKSMREEQEAFKIQQANIVVKHTEEQSGFIAKPTSATYAEINKLQDDVVNLRLEQEKIRALEHPNTLQILPPPQKPNPVNGRTSSSKSQPWNRDLEWKENISKTKTELEVVTNNDIMDYDKEEPVDSQYDNEDQNPLTLPSLMDQNQVGQSVRKETEREFGATDRSVESENSKSLKSICEENENQPEGIKQTKTLDSSSDTSATGASTSDSFTPSQIYETKISMSDDDASSKVSSAENESASSVPQEKQINGVEIMHTDDGSIEAINYSRPILKGATSQTSDDGTLSSDSHNSSGTDASNSEESGESSHGHTSGASSSGIYSSDMSTQSSSRSILEQIPEEATSDGYDLGSEGSKSVVDQETKELQVGSLILRKHLKESESKYSKAMDDYKQLVSKSQARVEKLEQDNQKLRETHGAALKSMANDSEEEKKSQWLKQENKMLLKSMEKQNEVLDKANKNYEKLQNDHSLTLTILEEKKKRYDQLILDFSNLAETGKNTDDYNRLKALHETVVLKLGDMSEDNERLEQERDDAIDLVENKDVQIRAYDEAIASLNKTEYDLKMLENVHEGTIIELQQLSDKNKELKDLYDKEVADTTVSDKIQQEYVKAKTEIDLLMASNKEFIGIEEKLNASEVKVAMLEEEDKKMRGKLNSTKKKSKLRADQMKDVISQYKTLKIEYSDKCAELERLEIAADGLNSDKGMKQMKELTDSLQEAKNYAEEATKGKKARENDLKIVLEHYEKLQLKYEKMKLKLDSKPSDESSSGSRSQPFDESPVDKKEKKEEPIQIIEGSKNQEDVDNLNKMLKESKESMNWKDDTIALTLSKLKAAKEDMAKLETEKKDLEVELSEVKSKLLLARKETDNAAEKQDSGQDRLRTAIAKHHQLQQVYDSLLKKFGDTRGDLQKAKNDIKVKEQEEKHARKRAATVHSQYMKLKEDHDVVVKQLEKIKDNKEQAEC